MKTYFRYLFLLATILHVFVAYADVVPRIAALADDERYMELLREIESISQQESSLNESRSENKTLYNNGGSDAEQYRANVIEIEQQLIDLRVERNAITKEVNAIEQQWSLDNLDYQSLQPETTNSPAIAVDTQARTISQSRIAMESLPSDDLDNLCDAEQDMLKLSLLINGYVSNYKVLARLKQEHEQAPNKVVADSIQVAYHSADSLCLVVATKISSAWRKIADAQELTYALLMESVGCADFYEIEERLKIESVESVNELVAESHNVELLDYHFSHLATVKLGVEIAQYLQLPKALDSLQSARDSMLLTEFSYPKIELRERLFIKYEPIKFSTKAIYTSANPIPKGVIYDRGVIYRLLVGRFKTRQAASLFKGAYPVSIIENSQKLLCYYIGGYQTLEEAEQARELLLKRGFKRPEVVEWRDGEPRNLTHEQQNKDVASSTHKYRVEISGATELSEDIRNAITADGQERELSKVGASVYVVGIFDTHTSATSFAESIKKINSSLTVSVKEI